MHISHSTNSLGFWRAVASGLIIGASLVAGIVWAAYIPAPSSAGPGNNAATPIYDNATTQGTTNLGVKRDTTALYDFAVKGRSNITNTFISQQNVVFDGSVAQSPIGYAPSSLDIQGNLYAMGSVSEPGNILDEAMKDTQYPIPIRATFTASDPVCATQAGVLVRCLGCTNPSATNYDPAAVTDNGSCGAPPVLAQNKVCYFNTNSTGTQSKLVVEGSCSNTNCTTTSFKVPTGVTQIDIVAIGPGGGGASYAQYSEFGFEAYSAGQGEIGGGDDGSGTYGSGSGGAGDGVTLIDRVSMLGRAGGAGGNGALVAKTDMTVIPGETFNIITGKGGVSPAPSVGSCGSDCSFAPANIRARVNDSGAHPIPGLEDQATVIPGDGATKVTRSSNGTFILAKGGLGAPKNTFATGMFSDWQAAWQACNNPINNGGVSGVLTGTINSLTSGTNNEYTTSSSPSLGKSAGCGSGWAALTGNVAYGGFFPNLYVSGLAPAISTPQYSTFTGLPFGPGKGGSGGKGGQGGGYDPQESHGQSGNGGAVCISWEQ